MKESTSKATPALLRRWVFQRRKRALSRSAALLIALLTHAPTVDAQDVAQISAVAGLVKHVAIDPTTYAPAVMLYESMLLDWKSSQPMFHNGFVEDNPCYTVTGLTHDIPVGYGAGKQRILGDALGVLPIALVNNASNRFVEHLLIAQYPNHSKLLRALGWVERIGFSSYLSYQLSAKHFGEWRANAQLSRQLGYQ